MPPLKDFTKVALENATLQTCDLLNKMPAEIRNRIYELTFSGTVKLGRATRKESKVKNAAGRPRAPGILCSCKQIYQEAIKIYWTTTTFFFPRSDKLRSYHVSGNDAAAWLNAIGRRRRELLRNVRIRTSPDRHWLGRTLARCRPGRTGLVPDAVKLSLKFEGVEEMWVSDFASVSALHPDKQLVAGDNHDI
ncbi:hypothetical protein HII31_11165 [Pseudocercospora fuligena]|uniref:Uncharacterized protein n=1 Tax=Pseudocercospora fuligena TaxID=685502 RepID=A0A8H6RAI3_9PEZI|nr:hypothetical protein HII31_11165 [Pseudocercospora fuligena]